MSATPKILIVVTSCATLDDFPRPTGYWLGEVTHFHEEVAQRGIACDIASPKGGKPPLDEESRAPQDKTNRAFLADAALRAKLEDTLRLGQVDPARYRAIYFAGGHGVMGDFPSDEAIARTSLAIHDAGGVVSAVCHGSAALLGVKNKGGAPLIAGKRVTGFANIEERLLRLTKRVPFSLQDELRARGGLYRKAFLPFASYIEQDGRIITGQNPQSARAVGKRVGEVIASGQLG